MGELKYKNLANLALQLLAIPASNADSEHVFGLVRRIKTEFRSSLSTETISSLIGCHFNKTWKCGENNKFEDSSLIATKKWTHKRNMHYVQNRASQVAWYITMLHVYANWGQNKQKLFILVSISKGCQ